MSPYKNSLEAYPWLSTAIVIIYNLSDKSLNLSPFVRTVVLLITVGVLFFTFIPIFIFIFILVFVFTLIGLIATILFIVCLLSIPTLDFQPIIIFKFFQRFDFRLEPIFLKR